MFKKKTNIKKDKKDGRQSYTILKKLLPYMRPYKNRLLMALISMSLVSLLTGILAYIVKPLINDISGIIRFHVIKNSFSNKNSYN